MIFRWTKKLGVWGWISVAVGGFSLTLVAVVVGSIYLQRGRIETIFAEIRAAGEPVTVADLEAMLSTVPPERDATLLWLDGFAVNGPIDQARFGRLPLVGAQQPDEPPLPGSDWPELALAEEFLVAYAKALKLFHEAAELGGAVHLDPMLDPMATGPRSARQASRLLMVEALVHAHKGDVGPTVASLQAAFAVGKACEGNPTVISFLIREAIDASAIAQLLRLLPHTPFSDAQLAGLQSTLRATDHRQQHVNALLGERVFGIRMLQDPALHGGPPPGAKDSIVFALMGSVATPHYLETMSEAVAAAKLPFPQAFEKADEIDKRDQAVPIYARIAGSATSAVKASFVAAARGIARTRLADIALAAQRYRLARGRLPATLDDLVSEFLTAIPLDPFTGKPLRYVPTDDGFVVYSVDADRKDDGGPLEDSRTEEPDLGYRVKYSTAEGEDASTE